MTAIQNENAIERRHSRLHEQDLQEIISGVSSAINGHMCRFPRISSEDMQSVVDFTKAIMDTTKTTKKLIWKILVSTVVISLLGWTAIGMVSRLKDYILGVLR